MIFIDLNKIYDKKYMTKSLEKYYSRYKKLQKFSINVLI